MKKMIIIAMAVLLLAGAVFAKGDYGTPGEFLNWGTGARSLGMGKAFTGLADDASAIYYNPAGLAQQNPLQVSLMHVILFYDTMFDYAAATYPVSGLGTFGLAYTRLGSTGFDARDLLWNSKGKFDVSNQAVALSYAMDVLPGLAAGVNVKMVQESVFDKTGMGFGGDLGLLYTPIEWLSIGLSGINVVPPSVKLDAKAETFPIIAKFGLAGKFFGDRLIPVIDVEKEITSGKNVKLRYGLEGYPIQDLALRVGMDETEITFGAGYTFLKYYKVDYSIATQELGLSHRFSVTFAFGGFDVSLAAEPKIFSPVGTKKNTTVTVYAVTKYEISDWELNVINEDEDVVRSYSGEEKPPATIIWDGKDDRGLPVSDGEYKLVMTVIDKNNKEIKSMEEKVKVSSAMPMQPGSIELEER